MSWEAKAKREFAEVGVSGDYNSLVPLRHSQNGRVARAGHQLLDPEDIITAFSQRGHDRARNVLIGEEITCNDINGCSLVVSSYKTREGTTGRIAVLGPTRMQYDRVVSALDYLSHVLEDVK